MRLQDLCSINKRSAAESTITVHGFDLCRGISEPEVEVPDDVRRDDLGDTVVRYEKFKNDRGRRRGGVRGVVTAKLRLRGRRRCKTLDEGKSCG